MSKIKITNKELKNMYNEIYIINDKTLCLYLEARFFNCGIYGWNYDVYELDCDTCLITGYRNQTGIKIPYKLEEKYKKKIKKLYNSDLEYNKKIEKNKKIIEKMILECKEEAK